MTYNAIQIRQRIERQNQAIELFHKKYSNKEIAPKMGLEIRTINNYLFDVKKSNKPSKLKKLGKDQSDMQKGLAKIGRNERIFKTLIRNPSDYRSVSMYDSKNTILQIRKDDPRSDEQIRSEWKERRELRLRTNTD